MQVNIADIRDTGKTLIKEISADDISGLAAELAYRLLLAFFPFFIFLTALGGFVAKLARIENPIEQIMDNLRNTLPSDAASVVEGQLGNILTSHNAGLLSFGIIGAIWAASAGINTMIKALNRAYDAEESRPFLKKTGLSLGLTVLAGLFFTGAFAVLIVGQLFARQIGDALGVGDILTTALNLLRLPLVVVLLVGATAFLYWAAPNVDIPFRWVSPGAVVFIVAWIVFTLGFGFYVANFGSYNATYGALAGVVVLMIWLYLSSFIMLVGAELNAVLHARMEPQTMEAPTARQEQGAVAAMREERQPSGSGAEQAVRAEKSAVRESPRAVPTGTIALGIGLAALALRQALAGGHAGQAQSPGADGRHRPYKA